MTSPSTGSSIVIGMRRTQLGPLIKRGGAGSVYLLPDYPNSVAKIYHARVDPPSYTDRIEAMLQLRPQLPDQIEGDKRYVQIAWPDATVRDARGRFAGFTMPVLDVDATSELEQVLQERQARAAGLPVGLGRKVTLAANLASVLAALHTQHHYVVDLKPVNLRFDRASLHIALLDCDGFSIQGRGRRFHAPQYTPDYLAPEYQTHSLDETGEETQDRFALAVVIFQLLNFGIHPYSGRPAHDSVPTDVPGRIRGRCYAYGRSGNSSMLPNPVSAHAMMPVRLRDLFDRAFSDAPAARPSSGEWGNALRLYAQPSRGLIVVCDRNREHQHYVGQSCASCVREELLTRAARNAKSRPKPQPPVDRMAASRTGRQAYAPAPSQAPAQMPPSYGMPPAASPHTSLPTHRPRFASSMPVLMLLMVLALPGAIAVIAAYYGGADADYSPGGGCSWFTPDGRYGPTQASPQPCRQCPCTRREMDEFIQSRIQTDVHTLPAIRVSADEAVLDPRPPGGIE
ncbi:kinase domain protein [Lysobacter antibioticus]|uniref:Kinase domain protein n=2 Tax=Lysobacter antibioticus TaxID=84531 RepID=A0A0S2FHY1_LYSAN|nr:kinase domain protein [Lysobacter antibioticus]